MSVVPPDHPASAQRTPRQRRAIVTRDGLLATVEAIVAAEGADAVTTTRVAAEAGVAVGTIYRYFADRDAMLLAAYDATVLRLVEECGGALDGLPDGIAVEDAARRLLSVYLAAAEAIPAHAGLLAAMRAIRPIAADHGGRNDNLIVARLLQPFLARFVADGPANAAGLRLLNILLGTLVDLYLMTPDRRERDYLHAEIEAHVLLALRRLTSG